MSFEALNRAALSRIFVGRSDTFDGVVTSDDFVARLADDARLWLAVRHSSMPADLYEQAYHHLPERNLAVIAAVAGLAPYHGGWMWWSLIRIEDIQKP